MRRISEDNMSIKPTGVPVRQFPHPSTGQVKIRDDTLPRFGLILGNRYNFLAEMRDAMQRYEDHLKKITEG